MLPQKLSGTRRKRSVGHMVQKRKEAFLCMCCSFNSTSSTGLLISFEFIVSVRPNSFPATPTYTCQQLPTFSFSGSYDFRAAYNQLLMHWHLYHMLTTEKLKRTQFQFFRYYVNSNDPRCTCCFATFHNLKMAFTEIIVKRKKPL